MNLYYFVNKNGRKRQNEANVLNGIWRLVCHNQDQPNIRMRSLFQKVVQVCNWVEA